ncbi:MAG: hypothetical protein K2M06_09250 [Muribaculaceae bacterium]|nr:hypothetical protein [Muribaculaceae bacterium]
MAGAYASSRSLIELQSELNALSTALSDLYNKLESDMARIAESWVDQQFEEFGNEFRSRKEAIMELSDKYDQWANKYLPPRIELALKYERLNAGIGG